MLKKADAFWMILKHCTVGFGFPATVVLKIIQQAFALVRKRQFRALVLQNGLQPHNSA
jgi:hypothetical protein